MRKATFFLPLAIILMIACSKKEPCGEIQIIDFPKPILDCIAPQELNDLRAKRANWQSTWDSLKNRCPQVAACDNGAALFFVRKFPDALLATSKKDAMEKLKTRTDSKDCCVDTLRFCGHGRAGLFSVGDGQKTVNCQHVNDDSVAMAQWKEDFKPLKDILCADSPVIILNACATGQGNKGLRKYQELSREFGVKVIGSKRICRAGEQPENLPDADKREVGPPVSEIATPPDDEARQLDAQNAQFFIDQMTPDSLDIFDTTVVAIGIYDARNEDLPNIEESPELPIADTAWINNFIRTAFVPRVFDDGNLYTFESSSILVAQYLGGAYEYFHFIFDNRLLQMSADEDQRTLFYPVTEEGRGFILEGMELSR